jgi:hypothetical protein
LNSFVVKAIVGSRHGAVHDVLGLACQHNQSGEFTLAGQLDRHVLKTGSANANVWDLPGVMHHSQSRPADAGAMASVHH